MISYYRKIPNFPIIEYEEVYTMEIGHHNRAKLISYLFLAFVLICIIALAAGAAITAVRFSNAGAVSGEADGLVPGGDRMNSYAWSMETMENTSGEEYLYVGSNRDLMYIVMNNAGVSDDKIEEYFNGDVPIPSSLDDFRAKILRKKTNGEGDWEVVYTSPMSGMLIPDYPLDLGYRGVVSYAVPGETKPSLYFGTMGYIKTRLLKIGPDFEPGDDPLVVYSTPPGSPSSIRAISVYNYGSGDKLYMGVLTPNSNPASGDLQIFESTNPLSNDWTEVASYKKGDFPGIRVNLLTAQYGGVWDMVAFKGYLYAFVGSNYSGNDDDGFMVFKGKPVSSGGNTAGWEWEPIVSTTGGKYPNGMGNKSHVTASPFIYTVGGKEYVYVGTFADVISPLSSGGSYTAILDSMYPCQVYRFDENDNWEMIIGNPEDSNGEFTEKLGNFGAGFFNAPAIPSEDSYGISGRQLSMNQYAWRMGVYNNKLYVTTFDMGVMLDYAANFTDDPDEKATIEAMVSLLRSYNTNPSGFDLYYTSDGLNFTAVTTNGFSDKYNYGGRTVKVKGADDAIFIGTANPFYGAQVWKITDTGSDGGGGGGGCNTGFAALALLGIIPLLSFRKKQ